MFVTVARLIRTFLANGPLVLTTGVVAGLAVPPLADACRPLLATCVFIFVAGTFLRLDGRSVLAALRNPLYGLGLPLIAIAVIPLAVGWASTAAGWTAPLAAALVLSLVAPPSSANAAIARMLKADDSVAFVVTTVATLALPVVAPLVLLIGGGAAVLNPLDLAIRLFFLLGSAGLLALVLRAWAPAFVARNGAMFDGIVVAALFVFALATMSGVPRLIAADPVAVAVVVALAYGVNVGLMLVFTAITPGPMATRLGVGISMGNRNVGLIWAVLGTAIDPLVALYFAAAQFPIFTTPLLIRWAIGMLPARLRPGG